MIHGNDFYNEDKPASPWGRFFLGGLIVAGTIISALLLFGDAKADDLQKKTTEMFAPTIQLDNNCSGVVFHSDRDKKSGDVETFVLTAKHCVMRLSGKTSISNGDLTSVQIFDYNDRNRVIKETKYVAEVHGKDFFSDLATIKLRDSETLLENVAVVADAEKIDLQFGQEVHLLGYPLGRSLTYTVGHLGFVEDGLFPSISKSGQFYRATPEVAGGNSGGPMFTLVDGKYQVVGITTGMYNTNGGHMNLFTPVEEINEYLKKVRKTFNTEFKLYGEKKTEE